VFAHFRFAGSLSLKQVFKDVMQMAPLYNVVHEAVSLLPHSESLRLSAGGLLLACPAGGLLLACWGNGVGAVAVWKIDCVSMRKLPLSRSK
jgi:hypothetical protein